MAIRTILVPTDFSSHASHALDQAIELARGLSARLVLLHCYWVNLPVSPENLWTVPPEVLDKLHDDANTQLERWTKRAEQAGVPCESQLSRENPIEAILELTASLPADMIVMGTHGNTKMDYVSLGSTTERILRLVACPVLTLKHRPS